MSLSTLSCNERGSTSTLPERPVVLVAKRHHYVSLDLATAHYPQTMLATHLNGQPLTVEHGAPLRLLAPVKLGLKNVKAITQLTYVAEEPRDYWAKRGYSRYDGI